MTEPALLTDTELRARVERMKAQRPKGRALLQRMAAREGIPYEEIERLAREPLDAEGRTDLIGELIDQGCEPWLIERHLRAVTSREVATA
jgi:hypothetical protein